jgi:cation diffusion facilitator family transporter
VADGADVGRTIYYALAANFAIAVAKFAGAFYTGSGALLAEALHSLADTGNQGLLLWGMRQAKAPATPDYPMGQGRAIYFWSFIVALMLFSLGGIVSIYEGFRKLKGDEGLHDLWVAVAILLFAVAAEAVSLRAALQEIRKVRGEQSLWRWFRETRHSELMIVLGEDTAALVGLVIALAAVVASALTGNQTFDAAGSIAIGVLLIVVAFGLGYEIKGLLIGQSAAPELRHAIQAALAGRPEIELILDLITLQQGNDVMVAVGARMAEVATPRELIEAIDRCETALRQAFPQIRWVFFEPQR